MNTRRFLAAMLAVVMLFALVPVAARAAEDDTVYESGKLYLDKTATLEDDGTYTIHLEAFATGTPVSTSAITGKPLDVVLVIDQSGSMYNYQYLDDLEAALDQFIAQLVENGHTIGKTHRVAVAGFSCAAWEMTVTHSIGQLTTPWTATLPTSNGSYASLWTNTGIYLNDGTFKNYQQFQFTEVGHGEVSYARTNMSLGSSNSWGNSWKNVTDFYFLDNGVYKQIQARYYSKNWQFRTEGSDDANLTFTVSNNSVNNQDTYKKTVTVVGDVPSYSNVDNFHVTLGKYTHPVTGSEQDRLFPKYFVDDSDTWTYIDENGEKQPQTVRRGIYQHSDGKWYYDFRKYDNNNSDFPRVPVNGDGTLGDKIVYEIDYSTYTGSDDLSKLFDGGYLTAEDYQKTFMNVTDGEHGAGNVTKAINSIIDNLGASGATRTGVGMEMAYNILEKNPLTDEDKAEGRERVVIVFTDGVPGQREFEVDEANKALEYSALIKGMVGTEENVDVYTIGLHGATVNTDAVQDSNVVSPYDQTAKFMNGLSSNYPEADNMEDVVDSSKQVTVQEYTRTNMEVTGYRDGTWSVVTGFYAKNSDGVYKKIQARYTNNRWEFRTEDSETNNLDFSVTESGWWSKSYYVNDQETYKVTDVTYDDYSTSGTPAVKGGKFYKEANKVEDLAAMFPTIVKESTSTSFHEVFLTDASILRDIMGEGFELNNSIKIDVNTMEGQWSSKDNTTGTIKWKPDTLTHFADLQPGVNGVPLLEEMTMPNVEDRIQIYNTNPKEGGNFYNQNNLTAPPTVDITGFDYNTEYLGRDNDGKDKAGKKIIVDITGVEAQAAEVLYDRMNMTNHMQSGLWAPKNEETGTRELMATFPLPKTTFTEALYVLDYAKPMTLTPADLKMSAVKSLDVDGMNGFNPAVTEITEGNGIVTVENGKYVYTPTTTAWNGYDTFYVFGNTTDAGVLGYSANDALDNLWGRVKVLPANNVYYEDSFIQAENGVQSQNGVTVGIVYDGDSWTTTDEESGNQELPESGETNNGTDQPFGGVHGWEDYLEDEHGFSDGSAHKAELTDSSKTATATFTFTGTGVDIYSYTDLVQGAVLASIYRGDHVPTTEEMQADSAKRPLYSCIMDNFSLSDGYYQIPTLSLHEKNVQQIDADGNKFTAQEPLEHDTYTVKLTVMAKIDNADNNDATVDEGRENGQTRRYTYHLDGIRIYNPIQNLEGDETVRQAYGEEELNASFVEVRDILLDAASFNGTDYGVVFLDQIPADDPDNGSGNPDDQAGKDTDKIGLYECYGPKNEVYLASGQSIAFIPREGLHYYVGLKSPTGEKVCVSILKDGADQLLEIDHTTDLYYEVTPMEGIVLIGNLGMEVRRDENGEAVKDEYGEDVYDFYDNLLSVTKIKVTGPDGTEVETADFFEPADQPTVLRMVRTLREEAAAEPEVPEDTEPTEPTGPEVDIDNPTEPTEPEVPGEDDKNHYDDLWKLIGGIFDVIHDIIFG